MRRRGGIASPIPRFGDRLIAQLQAAASDVITFHNYQDLESLESDIAGLRQHGRPIVCTEYLARGQKSLFQTHLPVFRRERVGCCNWGLVAGKTQTIFPWGSKPDTPEPAVWHHDIFRADGTPFDPDETRVIRELTAGSR